MGEVVGVPLGETGVESVPEPARIRRFHEELDDILVIAGGPGEDRSDMPIPHGRTGRRGRGGDGRLQLLTDQVLTKGGKRLARPAG